MPRANLVCEEGRRTAIVGQATGAATEGVKGLPCLPLGGVLGLDIPQTQVTTGNLQAATRELDV